MEGGGVVAVSVGAGVACRSCDCTNAGCADAAATSSTMHGSDLTVGLRPRGKRSSTGAGARAGAGVDGFAAPEARAGAGRVVCSAGAKVKAGAGAGFAGSAAIGEPPLSESEVVASGGDEEDAIPAAVAVERTVSSECVDVLRSSAASATRARLAAPVPSSASAGGGEGGTPAGADEGTGLTSTCEALAGPFEERRVPASFSESALNELSVLIARGSERETGL